MKTFLISLLLSALIANAADKCVRQGAAGTGSGDNWQDAYTALPATLTRGTIYYIADGNYGDYVANTVASGTNWCYIRKATVAAHGTSTGWVNGYGDGQAVFQGTIHCHTDYWEWDGQTRNEANWADQSSYGFSFVPNTVNGYVFLAQTAWAGPGVGDYEPDFWTLKYVRVGPLALSQSYLTPGIYIFNTPATDWTISRSHFFGCPIAQVGNGDDWTIEYNRIGPCYSKTAVRFQEDSTGNILRHNQWVDTGITHVALGHTEGNTAEISGWGWGGIHNWQVYGNIFHDTGTYPIVHNNGIIQANPYVNIGGQSTGWKIYNNIFSQLGLGQANNGGGGINILQVVAPGAGCEVYNNVWVNIPPGMSVGISTPTAKNNWVHPAGLVGLQDMTNSFPTTRVGVANPFLNSSAMDFTPKDPALVANPGIVNNGFDPGAGFDDVDPLGNQRGGDGFWDIGAFESVGIVQPPNPDTNAPTAATGLTATAVAQNQINLSWTAGTDDVAVKHYRVLRNDQQIATTTALTYSDTGLSSGTLYVYKIVTVDTSNLASPASTSASDTTFAPDTTAPSIPTNLTVAATSSSSVLFSWWTSTDDVAVTGYCVFRGGVLIGAASGTNYNDNGLMAETAYSYTVKAADSAGNLSSISVSTNVTTPVAPAFPTNSLALWLKADMGVNRAPEHTDRVSQWNDQSGNGRHATQATMDAHPYFVTNGIGIQPALFFDGENDFLNFTLPVNGLTEMTIVMVAANFSNQLAGVTQAERAALFWNETTSWGTVYVAPFQSQLAFRFGTGQSGNQPLYTRPNSIATNWAITILVKSNTTDRGYVNAALIFSQSGKLATIANTSDTASLGMGYNNNTFFLGLIAEVMVYTRAINPTERSQVETYLAAKYLAGDTNTPTVPSNLVATAISPTQINLTWTASTDAASGIDHYNIYRDDVKIAETSAVTYSDINLSPSTSYVYKVQAVDGSMNMSAYSATDTESTPAVPAVVVRPLESFRVGGRSISTFP